MKRNWTIVTICFILLNIQRFSSYRGFISDNQTKFFMNKEIFEETRRKDGIDRTF